MTEAKDCLSPLDPRATLGLDTHTVDNVQTGRWDSSIRVIDHAEWMAEGTRHFGPDRQHWKFRCPACGRAQSAMDFIKHGVDPRGEVFKSCLGRFLPPSDDPWVNRCRYTFDVLFRFPRVVVRFGSKEVPVFEYAVPKPPEPI